ncbi:MAG: HupE/UreJ family protein [Microbacterium sp.]|uniref:HupE/UreJ family protein n=1 Tax=Microbacterium sp. TaxID=51671 RepID=UPI0039E47E1A
MMARAGLAVAAPTTRAPRRGRPLLWTLAVAAAVLWLVLAVVPAASAHIVPWTTIQLAVHEDDTVATVSIPLDDLAAATGLDLGDETQEDVDANADAIEAYLLAHFTPTDDDGEAWSVVIDDMTVSGAGDTTTTGLYQQVVVTFTLTPPDGSDGRSFDLGYDAVIESVVTEVIVVTVSSDWAGGDVDSAYEVGTIQTDTVTGTVPDLHVDLGDASLLKGLVSMFWLGVTHIQEGTDHQLFLLTLLLPAPLLALRRRWRGPVPTMTAIRRITTITISFTVGHSLTLALGALGLPVPVQLVEAGIALSILVAAVHAIRPIFPGKEALVAGAFGLVHGLAFSETLRDLDLSGWRLIVSLLGFNLGIEAMQLVVVAVALPPLLILAHARRYTGLRVAAASLTGVAAIGWMLARLGVPNVVADLADQLGAFSIPLVLALWAAAAMALWRARRRARSGPVSPPPVRAEAELVS